MTVGEKVLQIVTQMSYLTKKINDLNSQIAHSKPNEFMQIINDLNATVDAFISIDRKRSSILDTIENLKLDYDNEWPFN